MTLPDSPAYGGIGKSAKCGADGAMNNRIESVGVR